MEEEKLISDIRALFEQLKEEEKGRCNCNFTIKLFPRGEVYVQIARQLISKANLLFSLDQRYDSLGLISVSNKEVKRVELFKLKYDKNNQPSKKSRNELESLMHMQRII